MNLIVHWSHAKEREKSLNPTLKTPNLSAHCVRKKEDGSPNSAHKQLAKSMFITKLIWSIDSHKQCKITFNFGEFVLFHNFYADRLLVSMETLLLFITPPKKEFNIRWYFSHLLSMLSKIKFLKFRDLIAGRSWHMKWSRRALFSTSVGTGGKLKGIEEKQAAFMSILNTSTF